MKREITKRPRKVTRDEITWGRVDVVENVTGTCSTKYTKCDEEPYYYISDKYYNLMVEAGELRSKEECEYQLMIQVLSGFQYDGNILVY